MGLFSRSSRSQSTSVTITGNGRQVNAGQVDGVGTPLTQPTRATRPTKPSRKSTVSRDENGNQVNTGSVTGGMHN